MRAFIIFAVLFGISAAQNKCPNGWVQNQDTCYYFITTDHTWFEADQYCTYMLPGGRTTPHLVSIETVAEHQQLKAIIDGEVVLRQRDFWTSGNRMDVYVGWKWSGVNRPFTETVWAPGEPNNSGACVQMWSDSSHSWDDAPCDTHVSFICETPAGTDN